MAHNSDHRSGSPVHHGWWLGIFPSGEVGHVYRQRHIPHSGGSDPPLGGELGSVRLQHSAGRSDRAYRRDPGSGHHPRPLEHAEVFAWHQAHGCCLPSGVPAGRSGASRLAAPDRHMLAGALRPPFCAGSSACQHGPLDRIPFVTGPESFYNPWSPHTSTMFTGRGDQWRHHNTRST